MSYLSENQIATAIDLIEDAGLKAKALNMEIAKVGGGCASKEQLKEWPHRIAALNAQIKAGIGMVAAEATFSAANIRTAELVGMAAARLSVGDSGGSDATP